MPRIFETMDISGRLIYLSHKQWSHTQKHPGITIMTLERMKETLLRPNKIIPSEDDLCVSYYFRYYKDHKEYLFISVKYLNGEGFIITSFYTDLMQ